MSHCKAKTHHFRFLVSVRVSDGAWHFVVLCSGYSMRGKTPMLSQRWRELLSNGLRRNFRTMNIMAGRRKRQRQPCRKSIHCLFASYAYSHTAFESIDCLMLLIALIKN